MIKMHKLPWPLLLLLICFWGTCVYGLNFGHHWDEDRAKFDSVRDSLNTGLLFQAADLTDTGGNYNYGGVNYLLTWSGLTPEVMRFLLSGPYTRERLSGAISPILYSNAVRVRIRAIYLVLSSLCIVWLFCLGRVLGRSRFESILAAAIFAMSWEVAYHSRWVAPDVIMTQFVLLAMLCLALGVESEKRHWLYCGAIASGFAIGTKYTGGLILPFFLIGAGWTLWKERGSTVYVLKHGLGLTAIAAFTFVLTTPGVVIDPFRFLYQLNDQREIYGTGWYGYTVEPGMRHGLEIVRYLSLQFFSHYWSISVALAVFSVLGIAALILERKLVALLLAGFCLAYVAYFSSQSVMIVRNVVAVFPFLALAGARGIIVAGDRLGRYGKFTVNLTVAVLLGVNLGWQIYAARQVKVRFHPEYYARQFVASVARSSTETFLISAKLSRLLQDTRTAVPANVVTDPAMPHTRVAFLQTESADKLWEVWPSNKWGLYDKIFGPLEVNMEAYSTFLGNQRILQVTEETFRKLPIKESDLLIP